jgi:N-acetylglucosamine-6-sulfatase
LVEYYSDTVFARVHKLGYQAVRNERWKYIHYTDQEGMDELYDLENDPFELKNLANDPASAPQLTKMQAELKQALAETGAK